MVEYPVIVANNPPYVRFLISKTEGYWAVDYSYRFMAEKTGITEVREEVDIIYVQKGLIEW